jgi:hypothetical protein
MVQRLGSDSLGRMVISPSLLPRSRVNQSRGSPSTVTEKGSVAAEEQEVSSETKVVPDADSWGGMTFNPDESRAY